jgi:signal transduction histidine kinase
MLIKKLRRKFIIVIMSVVAALMLTAFFAVLLTTSGTLERDSRFTLSNALNRMSGPDQYGGMSGDRPGGRPGDRPMPIITATADGAGNMTEFSNQIFSFSDSDVSSAVSQALAGGKDSGVLRSYNLRFQIRHLSDGTIRLAFIDNSMEIHVLSNLLTNSAVIGASTLLLFFGISILLSRWVVRPVEKAWNSQRQFIADASHELKTPLTVILSNSALLTEEALNDGGKTKIRLDNILAEAKRMKVLVDDLLTLVRSDDTKKGSAYEKVDLTSLTQGAVLRFEPVIFEKGKKLEDTVADNVTVKGDAARLDQLVDILLDNACKYSVPGSSISIVLRAVKGEACLEISNDSETIPKDELPRLFERFYRLDKSRSSAGYGLGLSIASAVVAEHDGSIRAASEGGRTVFTVTLPLAK